MKLADVGIDEVLDSCPRLFAGAQDTKTGRFAKVVLTSNLAIKLQKVFVAEGAFHTMEWRGCTKSALNSVQEVVSAKAFGNMGIAPKVHRVLLLRHIPSKLEQDNKPDYRGQNMCAKCWTLAIVMQRMTGSLRIAQHLTPRRRDWFWKHLNLNKVARIIHVLNSLGYDHRDIRHDNIGFVPTLSSIEIYLMDFGYGRVLRTADPKLLNKLVDAFCDALNSVGAPNAVCIRLRMQVGASATEAKIGDPDTKVQRAVRGSL